jgi:hypothetical protein
MSLEVDMQHAASKLPRWPSSGEARRVVRLVVHETSRPPVTPLASRHMELEQ